MAGRSIVPTLLPAPNGLLPHAWPALARAAAGNLNLAGDRETTLSLTISGAHKNDGKYVSGWERGLTNRKDARKAYQSTSCLRCIYNRSHSSAQQVKVLATVGHTKRLSEG